jgi:polyisoprenoid-binding protein YceI
MNTAATEPITTLPPGTWKVDPVHSSVEFTVRNMGIVNIRGYFTDFEGSLTVSEDGEVRADGTIKAASVQTRSEKRDEHLRAPDFFDVENHPDISFRTTNIEPDGDALRVRGDLTIRGITREVELRAEVLGTTPDPWGGERIGVAAYGEIDRRDFGLNWDVRTPTDLPLASHKVRIEAHIGAVKEA